MGPWKNYHLNEWFLNFNGVRQVLIASPSLHASYKCIDRAGHTLHRHISWTTSHPQSFSLLSGHRLSLSCCSEIGHHALSWAVHLLASNWNHHPARIPWRNSYRHSLHADKGRAITWRPQLTESHHTTQQNDWDSFRPQILVCNIRVSDSR